MATDATKDGGPAFPRPGYFPDQLSKLSHDQRVTLANEPSAGMTLYQWYAGQAIAGLAAIINNKGETLTAEEIEVKAHKIATAMIKAEGG